MASDPNAPADDETVSLPSTAASSNPSEQRLVFAYVRNLSKPPGTVHLDQALNILGEQMYPDEWGRDAKFKFLPCFESSRRRTHGASKKGAPRIITIKLRREDTGGWTAKVHRLFDTPQAVRTYRSVTTMYASVTKVMKEAIEVGAVKARLLGHDGLSPLSGGQYSADTDRRLGLLSRQRATAFSHGVMLEGPIGQQTVTRILVDQESLGAWLARREGLSPEAVTAQAVAKVANVALAAEIIERAWKDSVCRLPETTTLSVLNSVLGASRISANHFRRHVWNVASFRELRDSERAKSGKGVGGRRSAEERDNAGAQKAHLTMDLEAALRSSRRLKLENSGT